jgi:hypothetical protein
MPEKQKSQKRYGRPPHHQAPFHSAKPSPSDAVESTGEATAGAQRRQPKANGTDTTDYHGFRMNAAFTFRMNPIISLYL